MPEGPEVWILNKAICQYYGSSISTSYGKHLIVQNGYNKQEGEIIWSFGLNGRIMIDDENKLYKPNEENWIFGKNSINDGQINLYMIDWMETTEDELIKFVEQLKKTRGKLGPALINQNKISGIGVAWGSEILRKAGLRPDDSANYQDLSRLAGVMIEIREEIKKMYETELNNYNSPKKFIEEWFENLYKIRCMNIYGIGEKIQVSGRTWWV
jgi:formamidopyrimidine-DNA glycosylase